MLSEENDLILKIDQALRRLQDARRLEDFASTIGVSSGLFSKVIREIAANKGHGRETRLYNFSAKTLERFAAGPDAEVVGAAQKLLRMKLKAASVDGSAATRFWIGGGHFSDIELHARRLAQSTNSADIFLVVSYLAAAGSLRLTQTLGDNLQSYPPARADTAGGRDNEIESSRAEAMWRTQSDKCWLFPIQNHRDALPEIEELYGSHSSSDWVDLRNPWVFRLNLDRSTGENLWLRCLACAEAGIALQFVTDVLHAFELFEQMSPASRHAMLAKRILPVAALWRDRADEHLYWRVEALHRIDPHIAQHIFDWSKKLQRKLHDLVVLDPMQEELEKIGPLVQEFFFGEDRNWSKPE